MTGTKRGRFLGGQEGAIGPRSKYGSANTHVCTLDLLEDYKYIRNSCQLFQHWLVQI